MRKRVIIFFIAFMTLAYFTNPSFEKHLQKLKEKMTDEYIGYVQDGIDFDSAFEYHNYYFFSTTSNKFSDLHEEASIGILSFVF